MKKIVFTSNVSWAMIKFRYKLLEYLVQHHYEVYIIAPNDAFVPELETLGCHCIDIKLSRKGVNPIEDLKLVYTLYKLYKKLQPDIIFHYSIKPIIYGSLAAKLATIKSIAVNIGLGYTFINTNIVSRISHLLYKFALQFPIMTWFINEDDRDEFIKREFVPYEKTFVLPSEGIDTSYFVPQLKRTEETVFLLIARMLEDKGIVEFYEAAKIVKHTHPHIKFQLLGNVDLDNPKGIEEKRLLAWDREGIIEYLGYKKDVREYIAESSCVVLPSYREGKGMTLIEAASMEKPLIATNVTGCKDVVIDGYNGYLCEVKNADSLAKSFMKFLSLEENKRMELGKNSRKFVKENFDVQKVIKIYLNILQKGNV